MEAELKPDQVLHLLVFPTTGKRMCAEGKDFTEVIEKQRGLLKLSSKVICQTGPTWCAWEVGWGKRRHFRKELPWHCMAEGGMYTPGPLPSPTTQDVVQSWDAQWSQT